MREGEADQPVTSLADQGGTWSREGDRKLLATLDAAGPTRGSLALAHRTWAQLERCVLAGLGCIGLALMVQCLAPTPGDLTRAPAGTIRLIDLVPGAEIDSFCILLTITLLATLAIDRSARASDRRWEGKEAARPRLHRVGRAFTRKCGSIAYGRSGPRISARSPDSRCSYYGSKRLVPQARRSRVSA